MVRNLRRYILMAASGFTPISLYYSTTAAAVPTSGNLVAGELALNTVDEKMYFKNSAGTVKQIAGAGVGGASLNNDIATATNLYPIFAAATTGTPTTIYTSNANLLYKPSTGDYQAQQFIAGNGLFVNNQTINTSYSVPATQSAMSTGPITLAASVSVTLLSGARWVIL
jgi:hypothetical protein